MITNTRALVFGATGNIGGAVARELLKRGWSVRAVTRNPSSEKALALAELGAEIFQADMDDRASLEAAFDGIRRVFSVQNWTTSGTEGEIRQGKMVADVAHSAGVEHLVYGSAGTGEPNTGVPHFDCKLEVEAYMRGLGLPFTIIRPGPFMELLTEKEFYPALAVWGAQIKILGWDTPIPWVAVRDLGIAIAHFFENPSIWIGQDVSLFGDFKTMQECKDIFVAVDGKKPFSLPLPLGLFQKMAGDEWVKMWRWLDDYVAKSEQQDIWQIVQNSRQINPEMLDLESWLRTKRTGVEIQFLRASLQGERDVQREMA